ncbi:hypothetical protein KFE25_003620 [Diacronema lutheri]|uniref:Abasic site processing protein n=1 Tax=Diacronema lutheri TaxID=2081491 RepID=A0A8J5X4Y2_DIALT|nr:hypothetical protein KFE25_003620 [Diacronema lutheri]
MGATGAKRWRRREHYRPSNNLCPGRQSPALHRGDAPGELELTTMAFGLVPSYTDKAARPDFFRMANARSETVSAQPAFRRLLAHRRCVVPIDGFYEWLPEPQRKQPFYISSAACAGDRAGEPQLLWIAALWDVWHAQDGTELPTYALLTRDVSPELAWLHDRMPVVLDAKSARAWLDVGGTDPLDALRTCLRASPIELRWHKVHPRMSVVKYDGDDAHLPWTPTPITAFFERMPPKGEATPAPAPAARTDDAAGARVDADATPNKGAEAPAASPPTELRSESKRFKRTEADASGAGASLARAGAPPDTPPQLARRKAPAAMPRTRPASANRTQPGISSFFHRV